MEPTKKKTPSDTTDFEREQLRFFLSGEDIAYKLAELNPSLAWLPEFARMKVIQSADQLMPWIEKNLDDPEAVREVSRNLEFFDEKAAELLQFRLNRRRDTLPPLLTRSWQLIIRHIRDNPRGILRREWFDIRPRIKAGEHSVELLESLARILRPKPRISERISWHNDANVVHALHGISDLLSVDYEVEDGISGADVLVAWPQNASAGVEEGFLRALTDAMDSALADALEAEVESNLAYGISDIDVPSVAAHPQNEHHSGFLPIVRVIAEIWTRLMRKDASFALPFLERWSSSSFKLNKRLALFAAVDDAVPSEEAADILLGLPQELLFLTGTSVEVFRLIRKRWNEFSMDRRSNIEDRLLAGPPSGSYRSDADLHIERARFDILGEMEHAGLQLGDQIKSMLAEIRKKNPEWKLRPSEQAGFHIWHGGVRGIVGDSRRLENVPAELLIDEAKKLANEADFMVGDDWQALCQSEPQRVLEGLDAKAKKGEWPEWAWGPLLWAAQKLNDPNSITLIGKLLLTFPNENFLKIADTASWWLNEKTEALDDNLLWLLWDKIEAATAQEREE